MLAQIDFIDGYYLKRCDLLEYHGCMGGKAEGAFNLISDGLSSGYRDFVTIGSRFSPQCDIVSGICSDMGLSCDLFMPNGADTKVIKSIRSRAGSTIHAPLSRGGYTNVLISYATKYANENGAYLIPFGMLCEQNINVIAKQVKNIPNFIQRIVVPIGSGCTMLGIIRGLNVYNRSDVHVTGVITGSSFARKTIDSHIPRLFNHVNYDIVEYVSGIKPKYVYTKMTKERIGGIQLDPIYEGKCKKFLNKGDLLWIVGYHDI